MKVIIVNGSPRKNGATGKLLKEMEHYLSTKEELSVKTYHLSEGSLKYCKGCLLCNKTGYCIIKEDMLDDLMEDIGQSDAVVFGSPTYASNVSGLFKTLIDRGGFVFGQLLYNKAGFIVSTYENYSGGQAIKIMSRLLLYSGASRKGSFLLKLNFNEDPFTNPRNLQNFRRKLDQFYRQLKEHKGKKLQERLLHHIIIHIGIKPRIMKQPERYTGIINRWKELNII